MKAYWYDNQPVRISLPVNGPPPPYTRLSTTHQHLHLLVMILTFQSHQGDQRAPHDSGRPVDSSYLEKLGVLYQHHPTVDGVNALATERGYKNRDEVTISPSAMGDVYEEKVKMFFNEHLHEDEEIRYILDGKGYFDVRSEGDEWVRIECEKGDLLVLPAGIYHRFTTAEENVGFSIQGWLFEAC